MKAGRQSTRQAAPQEGPDPQGLAATGPRLQAQAALIAAWDRGPVQRRVLVAGKPRAPHRHEEPAWNEAKRDEFERFYDSRKEARNHLVHGKPVTVGLIKRLALWYRLPELANGFFVFGEHHSGVLGREIQAQSNVDKPILDEALTGWTSGVKPAPSTDPTPKRQTGLEENGAKLWRGVQYTKWHLGQTLYRIKTGQVASGPRPLPDIPPSETRTRITDDGSHRLVVRGQGGESELWKPQVEPEKPPTYDNQAQAGDAVTALFAVVFGTEIATGALDKLHPGLTAAWQDYRDLAKVKPQDRHPKQLGWMIGDLDVIEAAVQRRVEERYLDDHGNDPLGPGHLRDPRSIGTATTDQGTAPSDLYRDEYMLMRLRQAHEAQDHAFATLGDQHRKRLQSRLDTLGIPTVKAAEFYSARYTRDAV